MLRKRIILLVLILQVCMMLNASGEALFSNDISISDHTVNFTIHEDYSGNDAKEFRNSLDANSDGFVDSSEIDMFYDSFEGNKIDQYLGYILINNGSNSLSIDSFNVKLDEAQGNVSSSEINAMVSIEYLMNSSLSYGTHNFWILGHPAIGNMRVKLPEGTQLISYDGIDSPSVSHEDHRTVLEGASGIRSFSVNGRPTYEYAVSMDIRKSLFLADISAFNILFS